VLFGTDFTISLEFEPTQDIDDINTRINNDRVWVHVNYIGNNSSTYILNDVEITLTFLTNEDVVTSVTEGYLIGI